jgi:hypothetical protein
MVDGDLQQYERLKGTDIFEFWTIFDEWKDRNDHKRRELEKIRKKK